MSELSDIYHKLEEKNAKAQLGGGKERIDKHHSTL